MNELEARYVAEVARLEALIEEHSHDRRKVRMFLWALLIAPVAAPFHLLLAGGVAFVALSLYFSGLYLSSMHYWDRTDQLRRIRRELQKIRDAELPADRPT